MTSEIFFIGDGHGAIAAIRSLTKIFPALEIVSGDESVRALARRGDIIRNSIEELSAEAGLMAGHRGLLSPSFLLNRTILNIHYSLLPKYRGLHSLVWAMLNGEKTLGWSVHIVNEFVDDGPVVYQMETDYRGETSWEMMERFDQQVEDELASVITDFLAGKIHPVQQDRSQATWVARRNLEDCLVNFDWPAHRLRALFKALVPPYPLPGIIMKGVRYEVASATIEDRPYFCDSGRVVNVDNEGAWIKCVDSLLVIHSLITISGCKIAANDILRPGMRLSGG
jgi:methionyl-tRNA formyltransferase